MDSPHLPLRLLLPALVLAAVPFGLPLLATLPPSVYEKMQQSAPEALEIEVLRVERRQGVEEGVENIRATAIVVEVARSTAGLKKSDVVQIVYDTRTDGNRHAAPGEVPLLTDGMICPAFLEPLPDDPAFGPAAGAMSFSKF